MIRNLTLQVFLAGLLGLTFGYFFASASDAPALVDQVIIFLKDSFLAILRMLIGPLIFFSLLNGITSLGSIVRLKTLGGATIGYYFFTTSVATFLGLLAVFFIHPWTEYPPLENVESISRSAALLQPGDGSLFGVLGSLTSQAFTNPVAAIANLNILGIVTNAVLFGLAATIVLPQQSIFFELVRNCNMLVSKVLGWVILLLPVGIFAILFEFSAKTISGEMDGGALISQLLDFSGLVVGLTLFHGLIVLPLIAWLAVSINPFELFRKISQPILVAFSTSSSSSTLPITIRTAEEDLLIDPSVSSFVLPLGATINMDGTALFEALAAVFLAYLFGVELSTILIITVFLMAMVASIGAPGMPSASMAGMQMVLLAIGVPLEAIAILLVVERPLDTIRTSLNVEGDIVGALVVNKYFKSQAE